MGASAVNVRFRYTKTGRAKYISHLDMLRTFQRAFARAGIDVLHSEGFNPHPKFNLVLPLPTCCESLCEYLDAGVASERGADELCRVLDAALPEGIRIESAAPPVMKAGSVRFASWSCLIRLDSASPQETAQYVSGVLSAQELQIVKKTKRGESVIDLPAHMSDLHILTEERGVRIEVTLPCFEPSLTPRSLLAAMPELPPYTEYCVRTAVFNEKMEPFC